MINVTEQDMLTFFCSTPYLPRRPVDNPILYEGFPSDCRQMFSLTESLLMIAKQVNCFLGDVLHRQKNL